MVSVGDRLVGGRKGHGVGWRDAWNGNIFEGARREEEGRGKR